MLRIVPLGLLALASCAGAPRYDYVIRNGTVYDGSGGPGVKADVAIVGDEIAAIGDLGQGRGRHEIDATGLAVAPGFINMMSWATESLLVDGRSMSDLRQGVTLEVMGEGESMGPLDDAMRRSMVEHQGDLHYDVPWTTLAGYLEHLEQRGISTNVASFVGAATLRIHELGYADRRPTAAEMQRMLDLAAQAMEEGALGIGSALIYAPGFYADTEELTLLCKVAAAYGGCYASHLRSEGNQLLEALDELIEICRRSGASGEVYHLKAAGRENWPKLRQALAAIDAARARGLHITADMYTYTAGATGLDAAMPPWVQEGGLQSWIKRLRDPEIRARVEREMTTPTDDWENLFLASGADKMILVEFRNPDLKALTGKTLAEVAAARGLSPAQTAMQLVVEDGSRVGTVYFLMSEENVRRKIATPWVSFCSDAGSLAAEGVFLRSSCHPRAYGSFARLLGRYVREQKVIPLGEAVRRLTSLPAGNLGLQRRGALREGYFADIAVFDPATIRDNATYREPHQYASGMRHVFVAGVPVLLEGEHTGAMPGRFVHGPGYGRHGLWHGVVEDHEQPLPLVDGTHLAAGWQPASSGDGAAVWRTGGDDTASVEANGHGQTYNVLLHSEVWPADLSIGVDVHAGSGEEDRGGGVVWRADGAGSYYVARWNPLEHDVGLYRVDHGRRTLLQAAGTDADPDAWHRLEVRTFGASIHVGLDGHELLSRRDAGLQAPGRVGLWTKADASSSFRRCTLRWRRIE